MFYSIKSIKNVVFVVLLLVSCTNKLDNKKDEKSTENQKDNSHSDDEQISLATDWYFQILKLEQTGENNNYKEVEWNIDENGKKYKRKAKKCFLSNDFQLIHADIEGNERGENISFYFRKQNVFYVIDEINSLSSKTMYKIYYNENGKVFRILESSHDEINNITKKNKEVKEEAIKNKIIMNMENSLADIKSHLNQF